MSRGSLGRWVVGLLGIVCIAAPAASQEDVSDIPSQQVLAGGDANKRFFLIGPKAGVKAPADGFRLLLVLPGGDGSADFNPFVRRILKFGLPDSYLIAQLVAPKWSNDANRIVWPTKTNPVPEMKFCSEDFIKAVIESVRKDRKIDPKHIYTLGWSSGGPPCYATSLTPGMGITGTFVAMSVFQPRFLPPLSAAKGHAYYLLHSPDDFIPIQQAQEARDKLGAAGARTELRTYDGGHGWRGDVFGNIRSGIVWLEKPATGGPQAGQPLQPAVLNLPANQAEWERLFAGVRGSEQAESLARKAASLPPDASMDLFLAYWEKIPAEVDRQTFLRAFRPIVKISELDAIHLQILDHSLETQVQAFRQLMRYAFRDFAEDYEAYLQWYRHYRRRIIEDVVEENVQVAVKTWSQTPADQLRRLARIVRETEFEFRRNPEAQKVAKQAGILKIAVGWLLDNQGNRDIMDAAVSLFQALAPDESFLRKEILPIAEQDSNSDHRWRAIRIIGQRGNKWAVDPLLAIITRSMQKMKDGEMPASCVTAAQCLGELGDARAIPTIIGLIDSDNTYDTVYGAGYFCLTFLIGVNYDPSHDGPWWRAWWEKNKSRFPPEVQRLPIPDFPKTKKWKKPETAVLKAPEEPSVRSLLDKLVAKVQTGEREDPYGLVQQIAKKRDPSAIPVLIGLIVSDKKLVYDVGYFGLGSLIGVSYDPSHDGQWWLSWWKRNRARFPEAVSKMEIPRFATVSK